MFIVLHTFLFWNAYRLSPRQQCFLANHINCTSYITMVILQRHHGWKFTIGELKVTAYIKREDKVKMITH